MIKKSTPHGEEEFGRRQKHEILPGFAAFIATPEDVIIKKLQYYQEGGSQKHITDCKAILSQHSLDNAYLARWIAALHLHDEWSLVSR